MTSEDTRKKYETLISGKETVESSLHTQLIEHLNAEIVLGTIDSVPTAIDWLKVCFFFFFFFFGRTMEPGSVVNVSVRADPIKPELL